MRKMLFFLITILCIFIIYKYLNNNRINYVSIGDELKGRINDYGYSEYVKDYLVKSNKLNNFNNCFYSSKIINLTKDIKNNRTIWENNNEYYIKKILRESDILVISIGMDELAKNYSINNMEQNYIYFSKMYLNIIDLIKEIKKYAKGKILFLGYYNPTDYYDSKTDEFFYDIDIKLNRLMIKNNISYIDLYEIVKGNNYKEKNNIPFLNMKGCNIIASIIEFYID